MVEIGCKLSRRELQVLKQISEGYTNFEIAKMLNIADSTVRNIIQNIHAKTGLAEGRTNYAATRVKLTLFYIDKYSVKEDKAYKKGYNDGLMQIVKYINTIRLEQESEEE